MGRLPAPVYADGLKKQSQMKFYGYEALGTEGAIRAMENMTSDYWPEMAVREKRVIVRTVSEPGGMAAWNELVWANGTEFHYGDKTVPDFLRRDVEHVFAVLGDHVTIWPEKLWYDAVSGEHGSLEASLTTAAGKALFCSKASPDGLSDDSNCLQLGVTAEGIIKPGDAVTISGCTEREKNNQTIIVREVKGDELYFYDLTFDMPAEYRYTLGDSDIGTPTYYTTIGFLDPFRPGLDTVFSFQIYGTLPAGSYITCTQDTSSLMTWPVITITPKNGEPYTATVDTGQTAQMTITFAETPVDYSEPGVVTVARTVPDLDYVFPHENRLFGYKGDVIYASKWGDIFNWNVYDGLASDSWTTETGTPGGFTGGISYGGYVRLFKENHIFILYGDYPGEYQLQNQEQIGIEAGSGKSLVSVNGRLFYLSPKGPCVYAGGAPSLIADAFGLTQYKNGVGGTDGVKYYLSMEDENGRYHLFVYDTRRGLWMREDSLRAVSVVKYDGKAWCMDSAGRMLILGRAGDPPEGAAEEEDVEWFAEFGDIMERSPDKKRLVKLQVRLEMEEDSYAEVCLRYDSEVMWMRVAGMTADRKQSVVLPIVPRRLDHFRMKIQGRGGCRISSITRQVAAGSDR